MLKIQPLISERQVASPVSALMRCVRALALRLLPLSCLAPSGCQEPLLIFRIDGRIDPSADQVEKSDEMILAACERWGMECAFAGKDYGAVSVELLEVEEGFHEGHTEDSDFCERDMRCPPDNLDVCAHELGHALGVDHVCGEDVDISCFVPREQCQGLDLGFEWQGMAAVPEGMCPDPAFALNTMNGAFYVEGVMDELTEEQMEQADDTRRRLALCR